MTATIRRIVLASLLCLTGCAICFAPAVAFWQSRDSGYNVSVGAAPPSFTGPGDVIAGAYAWSGLRAYSAAKAGTKIANVCNSSDANCADINSLANGKFDVTTAQGAPLNCGGAGGTCTIKTLYDQSGNTNCTGSVACDYLQLTIATRPTLVFNCVGSTNVCMGFSGSQQMSSVAGTTGPAQPITYSYAANSTNTGLQQSVMKGGGSSATGFVGSTPNQVFIYGGSSNVGTATDGAWHALQGVANGVSSDINVDGSSNTGVAGSGSLSGTLTIGSFGGTQFLTGSATEFGVWASAFSSANSSAMSSNQHAFWGF